MSGGRERRGTDNNGAGRRGKKERTGNRWMVRYKRQLRLPKVEESLLVSDPHCGFTKAVSLIL